MTLMPGGFRVAVLASGDGSNFQSLVDHTTSGDRKWSVNLLVMNRDAGAALRARSAGIPVYTIPTKGREAAEVARETLRVLDDYAIDIVLLAGYLRRIPSEVARRFSGRILNIHPALLPEFGGQGMYGMNVHRAVVESEAKVTGATIHFVNEAYDEGAILGQWRIPRRSEDNVEETAAKVLKVEHRLYPAAVDHLCRALLSGTDPKRMDDVDVVDLCDDRHPESLFTKELNEEIR